jgi:hypothetical protein
MIYDNNDPPLCMYAIAWHYAYNGATTPRCILHTPRSPRHYGQHVDPKQNCLLMEGPYSKFPLLHSGKERGEARVGGRDSGDVF